MKKLFLCTALIVLCSALNPKTITAQTPTVNPGEHPWLFVTEDMYPDLINKGNTQQPWIRMKSEVISYCNNNSYLDGGQPTGMEMARRLGRISNACSLAYIIDTPNRTQYKNKLIETIPHWQDIADGQPSSSQPYWSTASDNYFFVMIALDIIHDDLTEQERQTLYAPLYETYLHAYNAPMVQRHPPSRETFLLLWKLYARDFTELDPILKGGAVNNGRPLQNGMNTEGYVPAFYARISESGPYTESAGYAHSAWAFDRYGRTHMIDILEFTGIAEDHGVSFYDNERWENFYEWLWGYASTPEGIHLGFGDTSAFRIHSDDHAVPDIRFINNSHMLQAMRFSETAGRYAMWKNRGVEFDAGILEYVLLPSPLPEPLTPQSRIFETGGGVFLDHPTTDYSLYGALWNMPMQEEGQVFHVRKDVNAIYIAAYAESLLMNGGFCGASSPYGPDRCFHHVNNPDPERDVRYVFSPDYLGHSALSNNTALVDYSVPPPTFIAQTNWDEYTYNPSYVNDHQSKAGGGVTEGFTSGAFDYVSGSSVGFEGSALPNAVHDRNFIMVHSQNGMNGYFVVFDELSSINGNNVNLVFHPNAHAGTIQTVSNRTEYNAPVGKTVSSSIGETPANPTAGLTYFYATEPNSVNFYQGINAGWTGSVYHDYFFNTYAVGAGTTKQIATILFPYDATHQKGVMNRISGTGYTGATIAQGTVVDTAVESTSTSPISIGNVTAQGKAIMYRVGGNTANFYFVRKGTSFDNGTSQRQGFSSTNPVSIHITNGNGTIVSPGGNVRFYHPGITGIRINGSQVQNVESGNGYVGVNVPSGTHTVSFVAPGITEAPTPTGSIPSPTPTETPAPGDVNNDGNVTIADLSILLSNFGGTGKTRGQGDVSGNDGNVTIADLSTLLAHFGR